VEQLLSQLAARESDAALRRRAGRKRSLWLTATGVVGFGILAAPALLGQKVTEGRKVEFAEHYDPPREQQMKWHVQGAKAEPLDREGQRLLITDARSETFRETGEGELIVEAPQAIFERTQRSINSAGPIHVQTADGSFSIEGEGFLWLQSTSTLFISNRVHTIVYPALAAGTNTPSPPVDRSDTNRVDVFSRQFEFQADTGRGDYEGDIRVTGENFNLTSEHLEVVLPVEQRRLETVTALTNVVIDYQLDHDTVHATGERADYSVATGLAKITVNPTWSSQQREGRGDELVLDRTNKIFQANGHALLKLPAEGFKDSGFLPPDVTIETNHFVEITCSNYVFQTNLAVFNDNVHVTETTNGQPRGTMTCSRMTGRFAGTNQLQTLLAETNVVFRQEDNLFTGQQALFAATNGALEMTGEPAWQSGKREGKGDRLLAFLRQKELQALGHAWMRLPATELGESMPATAEQSKPRPRTQKAPLDPRFAPLEFEVETPRRPSSRLLDSGRSGSSGEQFAEIFSHDYSLLPDAARFVGGVRIVHPQMDWTCEQMTVKNEAGGKKNVNMLAEKQVAFVLNNDKGDTLRGACDQATYQYQVTPAVTNDLLKMTGNPVLQTTNGTLRNRIIILDRSHNKLVAPGKYVMRGTVPQGTNAPALPNFKFVK